jgi:uncharacterized membrane protein
VSSEVSPVTDPTPAWIAAEVDAWRSDGLIDLDQANAILSRYGLAEAPQEDRSGPGRLIAAVSSLGAILLGVGVILFFAANWAAIGEWPKVALVLAAIGLAYGVGFVLRYRPGNYPRVGASLILLGALLYGAGVFLIMQIFHMNAADPVGVLLWTVGVVPLAYANRSRAILGLGLLTFLLWVGWALLEQIDAMSEDVFFYIYFVLGVTLLAIGYHHRRFGAHANFEGVYRGIGLIVAFVPFHLTTYPFMIDEKGDWPGWSVLATPEALLVFWLPLVLATAVGITVPVRQPTPTRLLRIEAAGLVVVVVLAAVAAVAPGGAWMAVIANIAYFVAVVAVIADGYLTADAKSVNIGLVFFSLGLIARYFDFFWDLLPRSAFFMAGGLVLIVGSLVLERFRRRLIRTMSEPQIPIVEGG